MLTDHSLCTSALVTPERTTDPNIADNVNEGVVEELRFPWLITEVFALGESELPLIP